MRRVVTLTDVTRMHEGRICIAGLDEGGTCVRPVVPKAGMWEDFLTSIRGQVIRPFTRLELDLIAHVPEPPHTEDWTVNPWSARVVDHLDDDAAQDVLRSALDPSVAGIFGAPLQVDLGTYVMAGSGSRSLGTVEPVEVIAASYAARYDGSLRVRITFRDAAGGEHNLPVTDLTWRMFCQAKRPIARDDADMCDRLFRLLSKRTCILRIGLSRGWSAHPDRCYVQITGVYTWPSYTAGKTHRDWAAELPHGTVREHADESYGA